MGRFYCEVAKHGSRECQYPATRRIVYIDYIDGAEWNDVFLCQAHTLEWLGRPDRLPVTFIESVSFKAAMEWAS